MYGGFAMCEPAQYQRTDLDQINIQENDVFKANKPVHIDKLFENEEQYLDQPLNKKQKKKKPRAMRKQYHDEKDG